MDIHDLPMTPGFFWILVLLFVGLIILIQLHILSTCLHAAGGGVGHGGAAPAGIPDRQLLQHSGDRIARSTRQIAWYRPLLRHALCRTVRDITTEHAAGNQYRRRRHPHAHVDLSRGPPPALDQGCTGDRDDRRDHQVPGDPSGGTWDCRAGIHAGRCHRRIVALLLSREYAPPLAYIGGSMGTLIGADLFNLDRIGGLGAPVASIGGAGTFDGIFLTGILAVLLAGIVPPSQPRPPERPRGIRP